VIASIIYGAAAIATGMQLWWLMSWAIWGRHINPLEYIGLLGSVALLVAAVLGLRRGSNVQFVAACGLLLLWPIYAVLLYATWVSPSNSFTFKAAIHGSVPAAMLLGASICAGIQLTARNQRKHESPTGSSTKSREVG
jgi:hypothetical protein